MKKPTRQMVPALAILALSVAGLAVAAAAAPPTRRGQEVHLFEATVRVADDGVEDPDEYNYRLLATVLGSVEAAQNVTYETYPGTFSAFLTNNQARRLSKVPGVLEVRQRDDPVPTDGQ
uniref:Inhibitor I9 domain-containing protein n=1 Tax=Oryza barthii TaxID=65489 RepID=A0A0D3FZL7_9ORYZ